MMQRRVMIMGCGRLGGMVAKALVDRGDSVTVLDYNAENFRRLPERQGLRLVVGDGTSDEDLRRAGIEDVEAFIALTGADTINALSAQSAQHTFRTRTVVCRINDPIRETMYEELGLRTVSPSQLMTNLVLEALDR